MTRGQARGRGIVGKAKVVEAAKVTTLVQVGRVGKDTVSKAVIVVKTWRMLRNAAKEGKERAVQNDCKTRQNNLHRIRR